MVPAADDNGAQSLGQDPKIDILPGHAPDFSQATFCLYEEDHTLGNALRWMIMKNPKVEFCGYSIPHPSEYKVNLRIQMYDNESSVEALLTALRNLDELCEAVENAYEVSLKSEEWLSDTDKDTDLAKARKVHEEAENMKKQQRRRADQMET